MKSIDGEALYQFLLDVQYENFMNAQHPKEIDDVLNKIFKYIEEALIKNEISVIRCKDCKHSESSLKKNCVYCEVNNRAVKRDWYCADGKRKE